VANGRGGTQNLGAMTGRLEVTIGPLGTRDLRTTKKFYLDGRRGSGDPTILGEAMRARGRSVVEVPVILLGSGEWKPVRWATATWATP